MVRRLKSWERSANLNLAYKRAREAVQARIKTFTKHGYLGGIPEKWRDAIPSAKQYESKAALMQAYKDMTRWLAKDTSKIKGYKAVIKETMETFNEQYKKLGLHFDNMKDFDEFGRFMGDMQERAGEQWAGVGSSGAIDLWIVAKEKGINPILLGKNFEYWREHLQDLQKVERIKGEDLTPGAYRRKMGLETISSFYKREGLDRSYSSKGSRGKRGKR